MSATPLIKPLKVQGGTLYTFMSASKDITITNNNDNKRLDFSKFALLNLPDVKRPDIVDLENTIQFDTIDGAIFNGIEIDNNINIAESFQNYVLNLENLNSLRTDYDNEALETASEQIFFKWLKELGAIRYRTANINEKNPNLVPSRFVEEDSTNSLYTKVVNYIGEIKVINNVKKYGEAYTEIYIHVPTSDGGTPTVLFSSDELINPNNNKSIYRSGSIIKGSTETVVGRTATDIHPAGLDFTAFYDLDVSIAGFTNSTNINWHNGVITNSYYTEPTFNNPTTDTITKSQLDYGTTNDIVYKRSKLDGVRIDWTSQNYNAIANSSTISTIPEYNSSGDSNDFSFNCVLIYYDIYNTSTPTIKSTNLYGVLFLDNLTQLNNGEANIQRFQKFKHNPVTKLNGNNYGLTLNLKFDTNTDNASVSTIINDYNSYSLELYLDALTEMQKAARSFDKVLEQTLDTNTRISNLESYLYNAETLRGFQAQLNELNAKFENANLAISDSQIFFDFIEQINQRLISLTSGQTPIELQYNTEVLKEGRGIKLNTQATNEIKIECSVENFGSVQNGTLNVLLSNSENVIELKEFSNYYLYNNPTIQTATGNVVIKIDDSNVRWKTGQVFRFSFDTAIDMGFFDMIFYTDSNNLFSLGSYGKVIGSINYTEIGNKPLFEIVCIDANTYTFKIDIFK